MVCKRLVYGGPEQLDSISLRRDVLRTPLGLDFTPEELDEEIHQYHMACMENGHIAGILLLKEVKEGVLKMRQVAVQPSLQGKGIGRQLVSFSEQWAIENGYHAIELNARKAAVNFYLGQGYTIEGGEFQEVGIPHLRMYKLLK